MIDGKRKMSNSATLSTKFQISVPKAVRESQNWQPEQKFAFIKEGAGWLLVPVPELKDLRGLMKGANTDNIRDRKDRY